MGFMLVVNLAAIVITFSNSGFSCSQNDPRILNFLCCQFCNDGSFSNPAWEATDVPLWSVLDCNTVRASLCYSFRSSKRVNLITVCKTLTWSQPYAHMVCAKRTCATAQAILQPDLCGLCRRAMLTEITTPPRPQGPGCQLTLGQEVEGEVLQEPYMVVVAALQEEFKMTP